MPTLKVEIAFGDTPLETSPTWTDVTAYVRDDSVQITRGRNDPWSPFQPGRCTLVLSNRDRRFDPNYSSGPYYGSLNPRTQIRLTATYSAVTYPLFRGFIAYWPQQFGQAGLDAYVTLDCYDGLEWASGARLSSDPVYDYAANTIGNLYAFYRQASAGGWVDATGQRVPLTPSTNAVLTFDQPSAAPGLKSTAVASWISGWSTNLQTVSSAWTVSLWLRTTVVGSASLGWLNLLSGSARSGAEFMRIGIDENGVIKVGAVRTVPAGSFAVAGSRSVADGQWHHVVVNSSGDLFIDGQVDPGTTSVTSGSGSRMLFTNIGLADSAVPLQSFTGWMQDLAIWSVGVPAAQVASLYWLGRGRIDESSSARIGRYLDDADWPSAWRDLTTTPRATVGELVYNNQQVLTALREVEASEQGRLFAAADGDITLLSRYHHQEVTRGKTVQATFSDDGSDFGYGTFGMIRDDTNVRNDVTAQTSSFQSRSTNSTSITNYGRRSETVDTIVSTVAQTQGIAAGLVYWWKDAADRVDAFEVIPPASDFGTLLGLELGDRIKVEITPMATGSQIAKELLVDSISWRIGLSFWLLQIGGAPVPPSFFVLGSGVLGTDRLGF